jgi:hypothetical protein
VSDALFSRFGIERNARPHGLMELYSLLGALNRCIATASVQQIEANAPPGIVVSQARGPLLAHPRVAAYFRQHGFRVANGSRR